MKRRLSLKFLAVLLALGAALAVGAHYLHGYQVRRKAAVFRQRAEQAAEAGRPDEAIVEYQRYLALVPGDGDARADFGIILSRASQSLRDRQAVFIELERALRTNGDRDDARERLVHVAMDIGRFADAREHIQKLLDRGSNNKAELHHLMGRCFEVEGKYAEAVSAFKNAIRKDPTHVESYVRLVDLLRLDKGEETDALMDEMVRASGTSRAYVARARYYRKGGSGQGRATEDTPQALLAGDVWAALMCSGTSPDVYAAARVSTTGGPARATFRNGDLNLLFKADQDLATARRGAPDDAEVLLESAALERVRGWLDVAQAYARRGLKLHPDDLRMYNEVANLAVLAGRRDEAIQCLRLGIEKLPTESQLAIQLAEILVEGGNAEDVDEASTVIAQLKKQGAADGVLDYLGGLLNVAREDWFEASITLERAYPELVRWPERARRTALVLGKCYEQLGDADKQYAAYRSALTHDPSDPLWVTAKDGMARAQLAMNNVPEAIAIYNQLTTRAPGARLILCRLLIVRNLGLPEAERDWEKVNKLLDDAARALPKSADWAIVRAQALVIRSKFAEARAALTQASTDNPGDIRVGIALAGLADAEGKPVLALSILDDAEKRFGDHVELRLARAKHYVVTADRDAVTLLGGLEKDIERKGKREQETLRRGLAQAYAAVGAYPQAQRMWKEVALTNPKDLGVLLHLFDLALQTKDDEAAKDLVKEIHGREGDGDNWRYCTAAREISRAERGDGTDLDEARRLLATVAERRPGWPRVAVCEGRIEELKGNDEGAIRQYLRAIELGERSPAVLLKTIQLLCQRHRDNEAYQVIRKLPEQAPVLQRMSQLVVDLSLGAKDSKTALSTAVRAVAENPGDYRNHLSLGRVYWALKKHKEAEESLRKSVELGDNKPETWVSLVLFLAQTERPKDAAAVIREMEAKLPVAKHRLAYAQCFRAVGQADRARELVQASLTEAPNDPMTLRAAAGFALQAGKQDEAEPLLRRLLALKDQPPAQVAEARVLLGALLLAKGGDFQPTREALAELGLVDRPPDALASETIEEKRARAIILALQRRRRDREEAARALEDIDKRVPLRISDQFILAQLYVNLGQWPKGRAQLLTLLEKGDGDPQHIAYFARCLLQHNEPEEAKTWVVTLEKVQPKAWSTVELKARLLAAQKHGDDAAKLLAEYAAAKDAPHLAIAVVLEQIGQPDAAEAIYEKVVNASGKPETILILAGFKARTGKVEDALKICDRARATCPAEVYAVAVAILYQTKSGRADQERVERWLLEDLPKASGKVRSALLRNLAAVYNQQGRFEKTEDTYRVCLKENSRDSLAMNNLAWLLVSRSENVDKDRRGRIDDALRLVQRAIDTSGPLPGFLDTRGIVLLQKGDVPGAVRDLEEVVADNPTAVGFIHLAMAYSAAENTDRAQEAFRQAEGLLGPRKTDDLPPFEQAKFRDLDAALKPREK
jgi:tetratricopeptide (TPR) repeat protein